MIDNAKSKEGKRDRPGVKKKKEKLMLRGGTWLSGLWKNVSGIL